MQQIMTAVAAQKTSFHARAAAATVADVMRSPLTTVNQHDHVAAAAYLMKHAGTTALMVVNAQTGQPAGIITEADVARAIADGKDINDVRVHAVMTTRPAVNTTTSIRDAAAVSERSSGTSLLAGSMSTAVMATPAACSSRAAISSRTPAITASPAG